MHQLNLPKLPPVLLGLNLFSFSMWHFAALGFGGDGPDVGKVDDGIDVLDSDGGNDSSDVIGLNLAGFCGVYDRCVPDADDSFGSLANGTGEISDSISR